MIDNINLSTLNTTDLISKFTYFKNSLRESYIQVDLMFVKRPVNKNGKYKTWMLPCNNIDLNDMISATLDNLIDIFNKRTIDKYDLELSKDDVIQVIEEKEVINFKEVMGKLTINYTDENIVNETTDYDKFDFVIIKLSDNSEDSLYKPIVMIKKHYKSPAKFKGTQRYIFNGKQARPFNEKLLIIGSNIDAVNIEGYFYIMNRENFNTMLNFKDIYYRIVTDKASQIETANVFDNPNQFIEECKNNGRHIIRLTKVILANGFENIKVYKGNLPGLIEEHDLKSKLDKNGKIIFKKENVDEILNLLLEHYVTSDLTKHRMLAKAIEKYK